MTVFFQICLSAFFTTLWLEKSILAKAPRRRAADGVYCFFGCRPPFLPSWLWPPHSVWAVPLLSPVTVGSRAKLGLARPYGLSLTKDVTKRLHSLTQEKRPKTSIFFLPGLSAYSTVSGTVSDCNVLPCIVFADTAGDFLYPGCTALHCRPVHLKVSHLSSIKSWYKAVS